MNIAKAARTKFAVAVRRKGPHANVTAFHSLIAVFEKLSQNVRCFFDCATAVEDRWQRIEIRQDLQLLVQAMCQRWSKVEQKVLLVRQ